MTRHSKGCSLLTEGIDVVGSLEPAIKQGSLPGLREVSTMGDLISQGFKETGANAGPSTRSGGVSSESFNTGVLSLDEGLGGTGSTCPETMFSLGCCKDMRENITCGSGKSKTDIPISSHPSPH